MDNKEMTTIFTFSCSLLISPVGSSISSLGILYVHSLIFELFWTWSNVCLKIDSKEKGFWLNQRSKDNLEKQRQNKRTKKMFSKDLMTIKHGTHWERPLPLMFSVLFISTSVEKWSYFLFCSETMRSWWRCILSCLCKILSMLRETSVH